MKAGGTQRLASWRWQLRLIRSDPSSEKATRAYRLFAEERTDALLRVCKYFDLDPDNPQDTGVLLRALADVVFGIKESKRPK